MKQCRTCLDREFKDDLICCKANRLHFEFREILQSLPLIGKYIPDYECKAYEMDNSLTGYPEYPPVNCRCSLHPIYPDEKEKQE